jgi:hypothetical protein
VVTGIGPADHVDRDEIADAVHRGGHRARPSRAGHADLDVVAPDAFEALQRARRQVRDNGAVACLERGHEQPLTVRRRASGEAVHPVPERLQCSASHKGPLGLTTDAQCP